MHIMLQINHFTFYKCAYKFDKEKFEKTFVFIYKLNYKRSYSYNATRKH